MSWPQTSGKMKTKQNQPPCGNRNNGTGFSKRILNKTDWGVPVGISLWISSTRLSSGAFGRVSMLRSGPGD